VPDDALDRYALAGTASECRAQLQAFAAAGIDRAVLLALGDHEARRRTIDFAAGG
jgi:alkanesulfonate monooxygenase SsuD/methylene tetrahydromethanopterin reductase-like flavin-dependent oxidoreductase (luciferase family)